MKENFAFLKVALKTFHSTGSFCPTSSFAADAMLRNIKQNPKNNKPFRILEVGPGTGSITRKLVEVIQPETKVTICEINPEFMRLLKENLEEQIGFKDKKNQIDFFLGPIQDLQIEEPFDYIVCALPFLNFNLELTKEIFNKLLSLSNEHTLMSFYQYMGIRKTRELISKNSDNGLKAVGKFLDEQITKRILTKEPVLKNVPPITVFTLKMGNF